MNRFPFKAVENILNDIDNKFERINWGGCGHMACILYDALEPVVEDIVFRIAGGWEGLRDIDSIRPHIRNFTVSELYDNGIVNDHVWVEFMWKGKWYAIDAEGIRSRRAMYNEWRRPHEGSPTREEMDEYVSNGGWNPAFDKRQVPSMKLIAARKFNAVLN